MRLKCARAGFNCICCEQLLSKVTVLPENDENSLAPVSRWVYWSQYEQVLCAVFWLFPHPGKWGNIHRAANVLAKHLKSLLSSCQVMDGRSTMPEWTFPLLHLKSRRHRGLSRRKNTALECYGRWELFSFFLSFFLSFSLSFFLSFFLSFSPSFFLSVFLFF